ncbi:universal stress protein [Prauserella marina]|uniref:Nucleotide-binding universal stress protein, UspA family n=1 Tax=Prauserella marina TaxID=530584 RepID=A0A222VUY3_9PSEU|nr:universal stress protein [Prauserella marina]ASR37632.1 universal stress protein [Prauserella marina]PWV75549.1 nucleotide-binding universal stress UspA family protein [Prauserella marina]SDD32108.1 Nucleotide-binding universal stress protein, UspA family [Prauserella marina]
MAAYRTVVVGTDGSDTSFAAVDRAASVAADAGATLVITCAYYPAGKHDIEKAQEELREEAYQVVGSAPAEDTLQTARDRAAKAGAGDIETIAVVGEPVDSLRKIVTEKAADLLVVGNRGLNTLAGRILGSVPSEVARKSGVDVLIVHTT